MLAAALGMPAADSGLLNLAMPDARVIAGISLTRVRSSPLGQFLLSRVSPQEEDSLRRFADQTGFDPRRDLDEIVFAAPGGRGDMHRLILARGVFDPARLLGMAVTQGARVTAYKGLDLIGRSGMVFAFLDNTTAVAGDIDSVRAAIDRRQGGPGLSPDLAARATALSAAQDAWFVSSIPVSELTGGRAPAFGVNGSGAGVGLGSAFANGDAVKAIEGASGGVKFGSAVNVCAEVVARTPQDASSLAGVARLLAGLAQMQQKPGTELLRSVLNSLDIKVAGNLVALGLAIPEQLIESVLNNSRPLVR
jgi:hypothetical protein